MYLAKIEATIRVDRHPEKTSISLKCPVVGNFFERVADFMLKMED